MYEPYTLLQNTYLCLCQGGMVDIGDYIQILFFAYFMIIELYLGIIVHLTMFSSTPYSLVGSYYRFLDQLTS